MQTVRYIEVQASAMKLVTSFELCSHCLSCLDLFSTKSANSHSLITFLSVNQREGDGEERNSFLNRKLYQNK